MKVSFDLAPQIRKQVEERAQSNGQTLNDYLVTVVEQELDRVDVTSKSKDCPEVANKDKHS
jgi:hypothetical protein